MPSSSPSTIVVEESSPARAPAAGDRIRLLLLTDTSVLTAGGSERFLRNLISRLPSDRYLITIVQLIETVAKRIDSQALFNGDHIRVMKLPLGAIYGPRGWRALRDLRRMVRRERFDIIQSQHEKSDLLNALFPRALGTFHVSNRRDMGFNKSPRLRMAFRLLNRRFDWVIAPSQQILGGLAQEESLDFRRMLWIPNGVDTEQFRPPTAAERARHRRQLDLADDDIVFGCIASLTPVKRHADLIAAFAAAHHRQPRLKLLQVGDGPLREEIGAMIASLGLEDTVQLLGDRGDVDHVFAACDAMVLASSTEGMSNAILEAMSSGLPVIATAVGGNTYLVQHETSGLLVPAHDPEALAAAISRLASDPEMRHGMGRAGRARILQAFSLDGMIDAFDSLYRRLLQR